MIEQPGRGRPRTKCLICSPRDHGKLTPVTSLKRPAPAPADLPSLVEATRAELAACGRDATPEGLIVLTVAAQIAAGGGTASGLAALVREFHASKARALEGTTPTADVIDGIFGGRTG